MALAATLEASVEEALLLDYAVGNIAPAHALVLDFYTRLSPRAREAALTWASVRRAIRSDPRQEQFCSAAGHPMSTRRADSHVVASIETVRQGLDETTDKLSWRKSWGGVEEIRLPVPHARLLRLRPKTAAPAHGHGGLGADLVLRGAFEDERGAFRRGQLAVREPGDRHQPVVISDEACVCLVGEESHRFGWLTKMLGLTS
jgi:Anti-sigma factor